VRRLVLALLAAAAGAAPAKELLRDEAFNFRILGELPPGWQRRPDTLVFSFAVDGIPHAYVHLDRQRLCGDVDVRAQLEKRATHYRFPGAPKDAEGSFGSARWAGRDATEYVFEARVRGVLCIRRVTALFAYGIWYERIETIYGRKTADLAACARGLAVFRDGFRLLSERLTGPAKEDASARTIESREFGFRIRKPEGFRRVDVDTGADAGSRVAFEARTGDPRQTARVRLFEYGVRESFDAAPWMDAFFGNFAGLHAGAKRESLPAPSVAGAREVVAERFVGERDGVAVRTTIVLARARSGRVLALRMRAAGGAETRYEGELRAVLESFDVSG